MDRMARCFLLLVWALVGRSGNVCKPNMPTYQTLSCVLFCDIKTLFLLTTFFSIQPKHSALFQDLLQSSCNARYTVHTPPTPTFKAFVFRMRFFATIPFLTAFLVASTMAEPQPVAAAVGETNDFVARGLAGSLLHLREPEAMAASPGDALMERDTNTHLAKRFDGARFTWFNEGLGSCGRVNVPSDFVSTVCYQSSVHLCGWICIWQMAACSGWVALACGDC